VSFAQEKGATAWRSGEDAEVEVHGANPITRSKTPQVRSAFRDKSLPLS
jgi:hypothetical protein